MAMHTPVYPTDTIPLCLEGVPDGHTPREDTYPHTGVIMSTTKIQHLALAIMTLVVVAGTIITNGGI